MEASTRVVIGLIGLGGVCAGAIGAVDPHGDTFGGGGAQFDVLSGSAFSTDTQVVFELTFADVETTAAALTDSALIAIELDTDQNGLTGERSLQDTYFAGHTEPLNDFGGEYIIEFTTRSGSQVAVRERSSFTQVGWADVRFSDSMVTVSADLSTLGDDDGAMTVAAIVGTEHNGSYVATDAFDVTFTSTQVPTPGVVVLGGLAMVARMRRRR